MGSTLCTDVTAIDPPILRGAAVRSLKRVVDTNQLSFSDILWCLLSPSISESVKEVVISDAVSLVIKGLYRIKEDNLLKLGGAKVRFAENVAAVETIKRIESETARQRSMKRALQ